MLPVTRPLPPGPCYPPQIRLSILLTWMFSRSVLAGAIMRVLRSAGGVATQLLTPLLAATTQPLAALASACSSLLGAPVQAICALLSSLSYAMSSVAALVLGPPARVLWFLGSLMLSSFASLSMLLHAMLAAQVYPGIALSQVLSAGAALAWSQLAFMGPVLSTLGGGLVTAGEAIWAAAIMLWSQVVVLGSVLSALWRAMVAGREAAQATIPLVTASAKAAAEAGNAAAGVVAGGGGGALALLSACQRLWRDVMSAGEFVRSTLYRCIKALQAVMNFFITIALAVNRHRVSLMMQADGAAHR